MYRNAVKWRQCYHSTEKKGNRLNSEIRHRPRGLDTIGSEFHSVHAEALEENFSFQAGAGLRSPAESLRTAPLQSSAALTSWRSASRSRAPSRPRAGAPASCPRRRAIRAGGEVRSPPRSFPDGHREWKQQTRSRAPARRESGNSSPNQKLPIPATPEAWEWEEAWGWISTAAGGRGEAGVRLRSSGRSRDAGHHADLAAGPLGGDVGRPARGRGSRAVTGTALAIRPRGGLGGRQPGAGDAARPARPPHFPFPRLPRLPRLPPPFSRKRHIDPGACSTRLPAPQPLTLAMALR